VRAQTVALCCTVAAFSLAVAPAEGRNTFQPPGPRDVLTVAPGSHTSLVVWQDWSHSGSQSNETIIYASRLSSDGSFIDTQPIEIARSAREQTLPQAAWNGQAWLVVWMAEHPRARSGVAVEAVRVSENGMLLDRDPLVLRGESACDEMYPAVSSDGTNWIVVWFDRSTTVRLTAARVAPTGQVLDPAGVTCYTLSKPCAPCATELSFNDDAFLVTWRQGAGNSATATVGMLLTPSLQVVTSTPFIVGMTNQPASLSWLPPTDGRVERASGSLFSGSRAATPSLKVRRTSLSLVPKRPAAHGIVAAWATPCSRPSASQALTVAARPGLTSAGSVGGYGGVRSDPHLGISLIRAKAAVP
jgi:hypothetical protein